MIVEESFTLPADRDRVAGFFLDVDRLSRCVPGVEDVEQIAEGRYQATLKIQLGPIRSQFAGEVDLDDSGAPATIKARGRGRDRSTNSQAQVDVDATLDEQPDGHTLVVFRADVTIRGRLGQFGTGVITSTARSLVREFSQCASVVLAAPGGDAATGEQAAPAPRMGRVVRRGLLLYLSSLWSRFRSLVRRWRGSGT